MTRTNFTGRPVFKKFIFFECNASDSWSLISERGTQAKGVGQCDGGENIWT